MRHISLNVILILIYAAQLIVRLRYVIRWRPTIFILYVDE